MTLLIDLQRLGLSSPVFWAWEGEWLGIDVKNWRVATDKTEGLSLKAGAKV